MGLKYFASLMLQNCPMLSHWSMNSNEVYTSFLKYKTKVPVCGAIILNENIDKVPLPFLENKKKKRIWVLLVKGWNAKSSYGFPRGKINKKEKKIECAKREVMEEVGFDISKYIDKDDYVEKEVFEHCVRLYYVPGVPEDTKFETKTRKEISDIKWFHISELMQAKKAYSRAQRTKMPDSESEIRDRRFYLIEPFLGPIFSWIRSRTSSNSKEKGKASGKGESMMDNIGQRNSDVKKGVGFLDSHGTFSAAQEQVFNHRIGILDGYSEYVDERVTNSEMEIGTKKCMIFSEQFQFDISKVMSAYDSAPKV
ncbi:hypothetical protein BB560_003386 [Smittium megazygosporum]|uniref:Nudix hydrolase domain-containing protein n=1 Tax=Smittium megazygosporum TaxID=133381 RepID=A0A2T9ZC87_9FUNG|nr:hypothetical protein BB560_003386 [Smittium megazygosporum]